MIKSNTKKYISRLTSVFGIVLSLLIMVPDLASAGGAVSLIGVDTPSMNNLLERVKNYTTGMYSEGGGNTTGLIAALGSGRWEMTTDDQVMVFPTEHDLMELRDMNVIGNDWRSLPYEGTPFTSTVVFLTSDPELGISDWDDLLKDDVMIAMTDPRRSSEAQWIVLAAYKWAELKYDGNQKKIKKYLKALFDKVKLVGYTTGYTIDKYVDKYGIGDSGANVMLLWESDALTVQEDAAFEGRRAEYVIYPSVTMKAEPKVAVGSAEGGSGSPSSASVLFGADMQRAAAERHFRPSSQEILQEYSDKFDATMQQYSISDFGGWEEAFNKFFAKDALFDQLGFPLVGGMTMDENASNLGHAQIGDKVYFGNYEQDMVLSDGQEPIEWDVLDIQGENALLLSHYNLDCYKFSDYWSASKARTWLHDEFIHTAFSEIEQEYLLAVNHAGETDSSEAIRDADTEDRIAVPSVAETNQYEIRGAGFTAYAGLLYHFDLSGVSTCRTPKLYSGDPEFTNAFGEPMSSWLRTPGRGQEGDDSKYETIMAGDGTINEKDLNNRSELGIRPLIWVTNKDITAKLWADTPLAGRESILKAQKLLNKAGYDCGKPDGVIGEKTRGAILRYRADQGMDEKDYVTQELLDRLQNKPDAEETEEDAGEASENVETAESETETGGAAEETEEDTAEAETEAETEDPAELFAENMKAAEAGDADAMLKVADAYWTGSGVEIDYDESISWYEKAVEEGNTEAMVRLGGRYEYGGEGLNDLLKAKEWYEKAAEAGSGNGAYRLGMMYYRGSGVEIDYSKAMEAFQQAADLGDSWGFY